MTRIQNQSLSKLLGKIIGGVFPTSVSLLMYTFTSAGVALYRTGRNDSAPFSPILSPASCMFKLGCVSTGNYPSRHLFVQSLEWKHQNDVRNLFKINNKDTRRKSVDFEKVNNGWLDGR